MDEDDMEAEIFNSKHPLIEKTKHVTKKKNKFRGNKKRKLLIGIGVILTLITVAIVLILAFTEYGEYNYGEDQGRRQSIFLVNWGDEFAWSTSKCYVYSGKHWNKATLTNKDAIIFKESTTDLASVWFPERNESTPIIMLAVQKPRTSLENHLTKTTETNNPFSQYDYVLSYDSNSDILWRKYQVTRKSSNKLYTLSSNRRSLVRKFHYSYPVAVTVMNEPCNGTVFQLVQELAEHMQVHIYGSCSNRSCDDCDDLPRFLQNNQYKFYLAFENDNCSDYISDDFYNALGNILPVVYGDANYQLLAPPWSYIDASKFSSMEHLANFLKDLDTRMEKYMNYYEWMASLEITRSYDPFDDICNLLRNSDIQRKSAFQPGYYHTRHWWEKTKCQPQSLL